MPNVMKLLRSWSGRTRRTLAKRLRHVPWLPTYGLAVAVAVLGYVATVLSLVLFFPKADKIAVTDAYVTIVGLVVLCWYAHLTRRIAETGVTVREEANKPFVVLERGTDPDRPGYFQYWSHNIGPGVAVNVFHVAPSDAPETAGYVVSSLGALGPQARRLLPAQLNSHYCEANGQALTVALVAEGIYTRTGGNRWMCTLNALTPTGEVLHQIRWTNTGRKTILKLLEERWADIRPDLIHLAKDARENG
jgi:hypothetical protein